MEFAAFCRGYSKDSNMIYLIIGMEDLNAHCSSQKEMGIETSVTNSTFFWYFKVSCVDLHKWDPWDPPTFLPNFHRGYHMEIDEVSL